MARKSPAEPSWTRVILGSSAAFVGDARVIADDPVDAAATSFRGAGWRVRAEVSPTAAVYGTEPTVSIVLLGDTRVPPASREGNRTRFPPDTLRQVAYWDVAGTVGETDLVLVVVGERTVVRLLDGPGDELVASVAIIRHWTSIAEPGPRADTVRSDLGTAGTSVGPVAWAAAAEIILAAATDPAAEVDDLLRGGPPHAVLSGIPSSAPPPVAAAVVDASSRATGPAEKAAFAGWLDRNRQSWTHDDRLAARVHDFAKTVAGTTGGSGATGDGWSEEASRAASALLSGR